MASGKWEVLGKEPMQLLRDNGGMRVRVHQPRHGREEFKLDEKVIDTRLVLQLFAIENVSPSIDSCESRLLNSGKRYDRDEVIRRWAKKVNIS